MISTQNTDGLVPEKWLQDQVGRPELLPKHPPEHSEQAFDNTMKEAWCLGSDVHTQ